MGEDLVKKIGWAYKDMLGLGPADIQTIAQCQRLEDEGFGMLEDKNRSGRIDDSDSVVCPDGTIFTHKQIEEYQNNRKGAYNSGNLEDVKIHKAYMYYLGFKG